MKVNILISVISIFIITGCHSIRLGENLNDDRINIIVIHGNGPSNKYGTTDFSSLIGAYCHLKKYTDIDFNFYEEIKNHIEKKNLDFIVHLHDKRSYLNKDFYTKPESTPLQFYDDVDSIISEISSKTDGKILLLGHSFGTSLAALFIEDIRVDGIIGYGGLYQDPANYFSKVMFDNSIKCAKDTVMANILRDGFASDLDSFLAKGKPLKDSWNNNLHFNYGYQVTEKGLKTVSKDLRLGYVLFNYDKFNLLRGTKSRYEQVNKPVLLVHGNIDSIIYHDQFKSFQGSCQNENLTFTSINTDHFLRNALTIAKVDTFANIVNDWINENIR